MTTLTESINQIVNLTLDEKNAIEKAFDTLNIAKGDLWVKQGKNGSFFSAAFSEPYVAPAERAPIGDSIDDDLPF
jgi:hypothetical protein